MANLSSALQSKISITCDLCKHNSMLEVANLITFVGDDQTVHEIRTRFVCKDCKIRGQNTFMIIYVGILLLQRG